MASKNHIISLLLILFWTMAVCGSAFAVTGKISGRVFDEKTGQPLAYANVAIIGTHFGAASNAEGWFLILNVPEGSFTVRASYIGFQTAVAKEVKVAANVVTELNFGLMETTIKLKELVVTPGHFAIMQSEPVVRQMLTKEEISTIPHFGEDIYRAVQRLPGVTGNDFSAKFNVRGGENEEILVLLDGMELYEPFHLKDIGGALSIIDVQLIGGIDLITGGFGAQYGDKLSGVFNINSAKPTSDKRRTAFGLSFMNARFMTADKFMQGRGSWLFSARRGYLDLVLNLMGEKNAPSPDYYDVFGKFDFKLNNMHTLAARILHAGDTIDLLDDDNDKADTGFGNTYGWLNVQSVMNDKLLIQSVLSAGKVDHVRTGTDFAGSSQTIRAEVSDKRDLSFYGLRQDWNYDFSERNFIQAGFEIKRQKSNYNYFNRERVFIVEADTFRTIYNTDEVKIAPIGTAFGLYASDRLQVLKPLTVELGMRFDHQSYSDDNSFSPRLNVLYALRPKTALRVGWGKFYQAQGIHELEVQNSIESFAHAELAEHRVAGVEHAFENGLNVRVEAYQKLISNVRPRYESLNGDINFFPEVEDGWFLIEADRAEAKGLEIYLRKDTGSKFAWWGSYAYAKVEDIIAGKTVPRNTDQRHTFYFDLAYRPNAKWRLNAAWHFHTGRPYTLAEFVATNFPDGSRNFELIYSNPYSERLPAYHRLDLKASRFFDFKNGHKLALSLELINAYNHGNVRGYNFLLRPDEFGNLVTVREEMFWFPLLPSIGVNWEF